VNYFAFGSNMHLDHLRTWIRAHGGDPAGIRKPRHTILPGYRLRTNYLSVGHGAGAATIEAATGHVVEGVLMSVTTAVTELLRRREGWPHIYDDIPVTIELPERGRKLQAFTFMVMPQHRIPNDLPVTQEYASLILEAAAQFGFSVRYRRHLRKLLCTAVSATKGRKQVQLTSVH
jgi:cation transport regulator ChaC